MIKQIIIALIIISIFIITYLYFFNCRMEGHSCNDNKCCFGLDCINNVCLKSELQEDQQTTGSDEVEEDISSLITTCSLWEEYGGDCYSQRSIKKDNFYKLPGKSFNECCGEEKWFLLRTGDSEPLEVAGEDYTINSSLDCELECNKHDLICEETDQQQANGRTIKIGVPTGINTEQKMRDLVENIFPKYSDVCQIYLPSNETNAPSNYQLTIWNNKTSWPGFCFYESENNYKKCKYHPTLGKKTLSDTTEGYDVERICRCVPPS